jgi:hypothetical protein
MLSSFEMHRGTPSTQESLDFQEKLKEALLAGTCFSGIPLRKALLLLRACECAYSVHLL